MNMAEYESDSKIRGPEEMADHWEPGQLDELYNSEMLVRLACAQCPWYCIVAGLGSRLGNTPDCVNRCVFIFSFLISHLSQLTLSIPIRTIDVTRFTHNQGVSMWRKVRDAKFNNVTMHKCFVELCR